MIDDYTFNKLKKGDMFVHGFMNRPNHVVVKTTDGDGCVFMYYCTGGFSGTTSINYSWDIGDTVKRDCKLITDAKLKKKYTEWVKEKHPEYTREVLCPKVKPKQYRPHYRFVVSSPAFGKGKWIKESPTFRRFDYA